MIGTSTTSTIDARRSTIASSGISPRSGSPAERAIAPPLAYTAGNPACATSRAERPSNAPGATAMRPDFRILRSVVVARTGLSSSHLAFAMIRAGGARREARGKKEPLMKRCTATVLALVLGTLCALAPAAAQEWPSKPARIIVPFGAGSTPDVVARLVADGLQKQ